MLGSLIAMKVVHRYDPIKLGALALVALTLPIWVLPLDLPVLGVLAALFLSAIFGPLVNAPLIGVITTRTPEALRPKVMTAVLTFALLAGPLGLLIVGPLLEGIGVHRVFLVIAAGQTLAAIPFALAALRQPLDGGQPVENLKDVSPTPSIST